MAHSVPKTGPSKIQYKLKFDHHDSVTESGPVECDSCRRAERPAEASSFCVNCRKYLCPECAALHHATGREKAHTLLEGKDMPENHSVPSRKLTLDLCSSHGHCAMEFYCKRHADVFCACCRKEKHRACSQVSHVMDEARGVKSGKEFPRAVQDTRRTIEQFDKIRTFREANTTSLEEQKIECLQNVQALRRRVNDVFDQLEKSVREEITRLYEKEVKEIASFVDRCRACTSSLEDEVRRLEEVKMADEHEVFVAMTKANQKSAECEATLRDLSVETKNKRIEFVPNFKLTHFLKEIDSLGRVKTVSVRPKSALVTIQRPATASKPLFERTLVFSGEHDIGKEGDKKGQCSIVASTFLPDGKLLICDGRNSHVKLLDQNYQVKSILKIPPVPVDVAAISNKEAVVTIPEKKQLVFLSLDSGILRNKRSVHTEHSCYGVAACKDELFVTCYNYGIYGIVQVLDMDGQVRRYIDRDHDGSTLFQGPYYLALNPARDRIYVGDKAKNSVCALSLGGKVIFRHRNRKLEGPGQMALDGDGNVYVCGRDSRSVHVISVTGKRWKSVMEDEAMEPCSIAYRDSDKTLVMSTFKSDKLRVYRMI